MDWNVNTYIVHHCSWKIKGIELWSTDVAFEMLLRWLLPDFNQCDSQWILSENSPWFPGLVEMHGVSNRFKPFPEKFAQVDRPPGCSSKRMFRLVLTSRNTTTSRSCSLSWDPRRASSLASFFPWLATKPTTNNWHKNERTKRQPIPSDGYGVQEQTIKTTDQ